MSYVATIPVVFPCSPIEVYEALCDLGLYQLWNSGMVSISHTGKMQEGLRFQTESMVAGGMVNASEAEVVKLVPGKLIELVSYNGLVAYRATFTLMPKGTGATEVTCVLKFEFKNYVLNLARPVIEGMAEARIRGDLETLRALTCGSRS
jgi:uncharacterized protein YndB with AHSA1/START domain